MQEMELADIPLLIVELCFLRCEMASSCASCLCLLGSVWNLIMMHCWTTSILLVKNNCATPLLVKEEEQCNAMQCICTPKHILLTWMEIELHMLHVIFPFLQTRQLLTLGRSPRIVHGRRDLVSVFPLKQICSCMAEIQLLVLFVRARV